MNDPQMAVDSSAARQKRDDQHTPLLAMWYQTREALADFIIPVLAGLKVVWLIAFSPSRFFRTYDDDWTRMAHLRTPIDVPWRALTAEERLPLDAAKFLLFGILTAALAGFGFDNTNRLSGLLGQTAAVREELGDLLQHWPALAAANARLGSLAGNETLQAVEAFFDRDLIGAIIELIATLFITMLFAYLFRLLVHRKIRATTSYSFWLYMTGMQFFTTAITFMAFKLFSLPAIGLPQLTPEIIFIGAEFAWSLLWMVAVPLLVMPRLAEGLTAWRTLGALLITHGVFMVAGWFTQAGFSTILLLWASLKAPF